ncbi:MAG: ATP-binding protein [Methylocystis sp.]|uniref:ATP-binding protein n=1 Tax=Methylocystis sp. TaxID=1911079 RepID=UPI00392C46FC
MAPASRRAVESIVTNLMENAARAEPPGGTITIRLARDRNLEVIDHGVGVDVEDRDAVRLFLPP